MSFFAVAVAAKRHGVVALMALALSATAQQAIQFSKPANQDPAVTANAFLQNPHKSPNAYNAPTSLFGNKPTSSFDILPGSPAPIILNPNATQWQKALEERKKWGLMTPAEILGVPTPESILGVVRLEDDPSLTPEQRYLKRQERGAQMGVSNAMLRASEPMWHDDDPSRSVFANSLESQNVGFMAGADSKQRQDVAKMIEARDPFSSFRQRDRSDVNQKVIDTTWTSAFQSPEPLPKPSLEQQAGMERFRAQFESLAAPETPAATPGTFSTFGAPTPPTPDPFMEKPSTPFNPAGFAPVGLQNNVSRPTGLTPLSGVTGPRPVAVKPTPLVQNPPWMSQTPQIGTMPRRQF